MPTFLVLPRASAYGCGVSSNDGFPPTDPPDGTQGGWPETRADSPPTSLPDGLEPDRPGRSAQTILVLLCLGVILAVAGVVTLALADDSEESGTFSSFAIPESEPDFESDFGSDFDSDFGVGSGCGSVPSAERFGDDPACDELWLDCEAGDYGACDSLYLFTPIGSQYEDFGATCGQREVDWAFAGDCFSSQLN